MERTRCFIAIDLHSPANEAIAQIIRTLQAEVRHVKWASPNQVHLTVKFLGDIDNRDIPAVCRALEDACRGIEPFTISLGRVGTFPVKGKPRVVWLGVDTGAEPLVTLHTRLDDSLSEFGVRREGRAFRPHVTLGRPTTEIDADSLSHALGAIRPESIAQMEVDQLHLIASFLNRNGPTYEAMHTVTLE